LITSKILFIHCYIPEEPGGVDVDQDEQERSEELCAGGAEVRLYIGNRNYSSWGARAWLVLRESGLAFEQEVIPLGTAEGKARARVVSPTGRLPLLEHEQLRLWDSLAIAEYIAELSGWGWPAERQARALARSVSAEMHSGFLVLRERLPMDVRASRPTPTMAQALASELERVLSLWESCRREASAAGPFLFGAWSIADCFFAPVVSRFNTYGIQPPGLAADYMGAVLARPSVQEWFAAARAEPWVVDSPTVSGPALTGAGP
jgi:glutathione S-transferase